MLLVLNVTVLLLLGAFYVRERRRNYMLTQQIKRSQKIVTMSDAQGLELFNQTERKDRDNARLHKVIQQSDRFQKQLLELNKELKIAKEEAVAAEQAKDLFLSNMSHEIRTPLHAILGYVKILERANVGAKEQGYLRIIENSGQTLVAMINDLLDFAKIRSGKFTIDPYTVDIVQELVDVVELFAPKVAEKGQAYFAFIDPQLPISIKADAVRIKQIFTNFISNAVKFTPHGGTIKVHAMLEPNGNLRIEVHDTGIGIKPENLSKVFDSFTQEDASTARNYGGTGLGLSICKTLAELMGGTVGVESILGKGSLFYVTLPVEINDPVAHRWLDDSLVVDIVSDASNMPVETHLKDYFDEMHISYRVIEEPVTHSVWSVTVLEPALADESIVRVEYKDPAAQEPLVSYLALPLHPIKIKQAFGRPNSKQQDMLSQFQGVVLLAEDNAINQELMILMLKEYGLSCEVARDGIEAIELATLHQYDLIFMDHHMPQKSGIQATQEIIAHYKHNKKSPPPIVALTANIVTEDQKRFYEAGAVEFLSKPIDTKALERVLEQYLTFAKEISKKQQCECEKNSSIDIASVSEKIGLSEEVVARLVDSFLLHTPKLIEALKGAIDTGVYKDIEIHAHSIAGSSISFGLEALYAQARIIEEAARKQNSSFDYRSHVVTLEELFISVQLL